jgi:VWFA-related protein
MVRVPRRARSAALLLILAGATGAILAAQAPSASQQPTFKATVEYVEVDAIVSDRQGNFVRDLKKEDFQVLEDGKPQSIATFSVVDIPVERYDRPLFAANPIEPDVRTNERPFDGRVYVMVIDDLHTLFGRGARVKVAAKEFIQKHLGANDLMAVVHTAGPTDANQEFTNNKRLLQQAVDRVSGQKVQSATINKTQEYYNTRDMRQAGDALNDPDDAERAFKARSTLATLKNVSDWFANVRGRRKAILFVSEGIDYDVNDIFGSGTGSNHNSATTILDDTRDLIAAATRANVAIYGIDPRGLTDLSDESITLTNFPDDATLGVGSGSLMNEVRLSQDSLRTISDETGGFAVVNHNQFADAYDRIVGDNSSYYVLAYYPPTDKPGKFHKIDVRVTRPGLTVRARRGYALPKVKAVSTKPPAPNAPSAEVREAIDSPIPVSGLTMHVFAAPFKGTAPNASVLFGVEMRGRDLRPAPNDMLELTYMAIDANGKVKGGNTDKVTLNLKPETKARVEQTGLRLLNRLDLPPGRYQLRLAAHDSVGGTVGSVLYDLEVPDFAKGPMSMSGIVLSSATGAAQPTARPDEQLKQVLPAPPVALRAFPQNDELMLFAEIYDNVPNPTHNVDITTTVTTDTGEVKFKTDEERSSGDLGGKPGGYGYSARIPLKDLAPGAYVLKVEGKSRMGASPSTAREVRFTVEPPRPPSPGAAR